MGLPEGLDAIEPGPGLNLLLGANGSGKSSLTAGVLQALLGDMKDDQLVINISLENGAALSHAHLKSTWGGDSPSLPPRHLANSYRLGLLDLGEQGASEADLVQRLKRELAGGYDLESIARGRRVKQGHGRKTWTRLQNAQQELQRALNRYDDLQRQQKGLEALKAELVLAEEGQARLRTLEKAQQYCRRQLSIVRDEAILEAAPDDWRQTPKDAVEQVQDAEGQLDAFDQRRADLVAEVDRLDAQIGALELSEPLSDHELSAWRQRAKRLEGWEREQAERHLQRATLQPAIEVEDQGQLLPNVDALEGKILERASLAQQIQALDLQMGVGDALSVALPESIHLGRDLLAQWLQAVRPRRLPGWLLFVLALLLLIGLVLGIQGQWLGYGVAGIACFLLVWTQQDPEDNRQHLRRRYEDTGLPRPESWDVTSVGETMGSLSDQLEADDKARAQAQIRSQNEAARQQAQGALDELDRELVELARSLGLKDDISGLGLREAVEALKDRRALRDLDGAVQAADLEADELRQQALDALGHLGLAHPVDGPGLETFVDALGGRCRDLAHLGREKAQVIERIAALDRDREAVSVRQKSLLADGDLNALGDRVRRALEAGVAEIRLVRDRRELQELADQIGDADLLDCDEQTLEMLMKECDEALASLTSLGEQIGATEEAVRAARDEAPLRQADQALEAAREALELDYEDGLECLADQFLAQRLQLDYQSKASPQLFGRVRNRLEDFTMGRYDLELRGMELRAVDRAGLGSQGLSELSHGTRVQLLLAARLAFIEEHEEGALLPLFLDEALSITDHERFEAVAKVLMDLVAEGRQVFYLSCDAGDVHRWCRTAESLGKPAPKVIKIGNMATLEPFDAERDVLGPQADERSEDYGRRIGVSEFNLWSSSDALDIFYLLEDRLDLIHRLRQVRQRRLGPYTALRRRARNPAQLSADDLALLDHRAALFHDFLRLQRVGRGSPVRREAFVDDRLRPKSRELLQDLLDKVGGDVEALVRKVEAREGDAFRRKQRDLAEVLVQILEEEGALDTRSIMEPEDRLGRLADQHGDRVGLESLAWLDRLWSQRVTGILEGG